jgi:hypothetical protein
MDPCVAEPYREQGRYTEAEPLYKRVLAIEEKALDSLRQAQFLRSQRWGSAALGQQRLHDHSL